MLRQTSPTSSESYVSLDLLSYLESGQAMPFHIFADVVMPDFRHHLSKFQPHSERDRLHGMFEEIGKDLYYIKGACGKVKQWEDLVNNEIKELIIQCFDDAFKDGTEALETPRRTNFLQDKLEKTQNVVSKLRTQIFSLPELSSVNLDSESFNRSSFSMRDDRLVEQRDQNMIQFQSVYNRLKPGPKKCLLCFSVFPDNAVIKKKVLVHWWVGEGFLDDSPSSKGKTAEEAGNECFRDFISEGIIEPVNKNRRRPSSENCKMKPSIRYAVIEHAKKDGFFCFDTEGNPTANFCDSVRACLVKTEKGSSLRQFNYSFHLKKEKVQTLFNVNEPHLDFKVDFFLKMKCVKVLQLGRWEASAKQLVEVEDAGFLKGLKNMKDLRYFSLRGISRITEIPDSICRLSNLRILNLNGCQNLEKLPDGIGSLKMLTHLDMSECYLISHMPKGLALLSQLQVLKGFVIRKPRRGGHYCKLVDLAKLGNLRKLGIHVDRTHAESEEELRSLHEFKSLESLSVAWSQIYNSSTPRNEATIQRIVSMEPIIKKINSLRSTPDRTTPASTSPPPLASLAKLGLQYFPGPKMPDWLETLALQNLKKLYVRGGDLSRLRSVVYRPETVEALRLKYLPKLQMNWSELQALFPKLTYLEKVECPKLSLFPCDENGEWISEADEVRDNSDDVTLATISENVSDQKKAHISKSISAFEFKSHNHRVIKRSSSSKV